ncbi:acyl transferase/acyl hydrolase/lysophospholipase [Massariosphaeria phaeospora]|uniref:Acyl transferase/acyl hydrolase/lysophospholipase n=1 Tax=Massariosphaeria phaeospora TaxID=100035 RepID=A0A7C8I1Q8_9PLEO|nr:acyl transferase/acyl hydrolase/lysophospholipase [Massariosphaeria phaeospora]
MATPYSASSTSIAGPSIAPSNASTPHKGKERSFRDDSDDCDRISYRREYPLDEVWSQQNLLSLDGGGIRGYWSLLVLKKLMKAIAAEERRQAYLKGSDNSLHSFLPHAYPEGATQGPLNGKELARKNGETDICNFLRDSRKFLPCHYFDYICGSSTGALIAIMLGRFRMTVHDCLREYETMSNIIFGRPRLVSQRNIAIVPWSKYSAAAMERALKDVTARRCEVNQQLHNVKFPSPAGICKTFVTTYKYERTKGSKGSQTTLYLLRSYDHEEKEDLPLQDRRRTGTGQSNRAHRKNFGKADALHIWEVARAATAAPMYFKEIVFQRNSIEGGTEMFFSDGGFGQTNNPTQEGILEIASLHGKHNVGAVVNIGTSKDTLESGGKSIFKRVREFVDRATDPTIVAGQLDGRDLYWRFNDDRGLGVELDDWKPSGFSTRDPGHKTLRKIRTQFNRWAKNSSNTRHIEQCARELVARRRRRADDATLWEAYATGAVFICGYSACNNAQFENGDRLGEHLEEKHAVPPEESKKTVRRMTKRWLYQTPPKT